MKILVIDDTEDIRFLLRRVLNASGHEVRLVADGKTALASLDDESPSVIFLDVQMPEVDGWDILSTIRSRRELDDVAVVLCTVKGSAVDMQRGFELGCDGFVAKPFDIDQLPRVIDAAIVRRRASGSTVTQGRG